MLSNTRELVVVVEADAIEREGVLTEINFTAVHVKQHSLGSLASLLAKK